VNEKKTAGYIIPFRRHPLVGLSIFYLCGIWAGLTYTIPLFPVAGIYFLVVAFICVIYVWNLSRKPSEEGILRRSSNLLCLISAFLAAYCVTQLHPLHPRYSSVMAHHIDFVESMNLSTNSIQLESGTTSEYGIESSGSSQTGSSKSVVCYLQGRIVWDPEIYLLSDDNKWLIKFPVRIEKLIVRGHKLPVEGRRIKVLMYSRDSVPNMEYGMRISVKGALIKNKSADRYDRWKEDYMVRTHSTSSKVLSTGHGDMFLSWCFANRRQSSQYLKTGIEKYPAVSAILRAILLGDDTDMRKEWKTIFFETGTLHIFAISGLHIAMIASIITVFLGALGIPRTRWILFVGPIIIIYTLATGARASAIRACIMTIMFLLAPLVKRQFDILSAVACASIFITTIDPSQLRNAGFLMSFICVLGLIAFCPRFEHSMRWATTPDPLQLETEGRGREMMRKIAKYFLSLASAATAGWLASAPLIAYFFGVVTPVTLIGNLIAVPLAFLVVLAGCLSIILGSCCIWFADIFNHANVIIVSTLMWWLDMLRRIPGGTFRIGEMKLYTVWTIYAILIAVVFVIYLWQSKPNLIINKQQESKSL